MKKLKKIKRDNFISFYPFLIHYFIKTIFKQIKQLFIIQNTLYHLTFIIIKEKRLNTKNKYNEKLTK